MVKVKALQTSVGDYGKLKAGQEIEMPDRVAKELAASGLVEIIDMQEKAEVDSTPEKKETGHAPKKEMDPTPEKKTSIRITESDSVKKLRKENETAFNKGK
ncbi:hypothetical protein [Flavitalea sp.]|nr:hypothetical protein [Flavitalea sp.]